MNNICFDLEQLITLTPGHVYWLDRHNIYQGCNDSQAKTFGLSSRLAIIGKRNKDLPNMNPTIACTWDENNLMVINSGKAAILEEPCLSEDGQEVFVLSHKTPLRNASGDIIGLLGMSIDMTFLKKQQDQLHKRIEQTDLSLDHILSHMPGHVYWKNKEGVYLGCNDKQAVTLGFSIGKDVLGKTDFDLAWGSTLASVYRENDLRIISSGITEKFEETALIDGKEVVYLSLKAPLKNKHNETEGILGISIDISKQKEFEKKLIEAKEIAESANKAKSQFLYNMRHDLRTPFNGVLGIAQILEKEETDLIKKEKIGYVAQSAEVLLNHINQIFEMINIESGDFPLLYKQFNIYDLMNDTLKIMMPSAKNKGLFFTVKCSDDLPQYLIGDSMRMQRVLINLIANSIKFTEKGHVRLEATVAKKENRMIIVKFTVEDTGIGIPEDKADFVFEHFNRLNPSESSLYPGKGLGLRIVKQFLDEMGGEIHLKSELNKGTCFKILVPFKETLLNCAEETL